MRSSIIRDDGMTSCNWQNIMIDLRGKHTDYRVLILYLKNILLIRFMAVQSIPKVVRAFLCFIIYFARFRESVGFLCRSCACLFSCVCASCAGGAVAILFPTVSRLFLVISDFSQMCKCPKKEGAPSRRRTLHFFNFIYF